MRLSFATLFLSQFLVADVTFAADAPSDRAIDRRLGTRSYLLDDTGTMMATFGTRATYLRYGIIKQWGTYPYNTVSPTVIDQSVFNGATPVKVTSGYYQQCALLDDGKVSCWGAFGNYYGMGDGITSNQEQGPVIVQVDVNGALEDLSDVVDIASGVHDTCTVKSNRSILCFGPNDGHAESVNGNYDGSTLEKQVRFVATGDTYTCVVSEVNEVRCFGRIFTTAHIPHTPPYPVSDIVTGMGSGGGTHVCYLMNIPSSTEMNMKCFGANLYGELGNGSTNSAWSDTPIFPSVLDSKISSISVGTRTTCAVKAADNSQWCWGRNDNKQLGVADDTDDRLQPTQVITTSNLDQSLIHSIFTHSNAGHVLLTDGTVYAWGKNTHGLLGANVPNTNPVDVNNSISGNGSSLPVFSSVIAEPTDWTPPSWAIGSGSDTSPPSASLSPSSAPSSTPSLSVFPSKTPSSSPSVSIGPSATSSLTPSSVPSEKPSNNPSANPSQFPTVSLQPSLGSFSWDIILDTTGYLNTPPIEDGVQDFITAYNISDRDYNIEVFKDDCYTPSGDLALTTTVDSKSSGQNHLEAAFLYNQTVIQSSNLWTASSTGGDVDFCVKLSLYSNSSGGILSNFIETIYKIEVDLTAGFSTAVGVLRTAAGNGGVERIITDENITVYQCNDSFDELTLPPPLAQGDALQICFMTDNDSLFEVGAVEDVTIRQNGTMAFDYVTSFVDSYWAVSSCMAINTTVSKCKVKIQLIGAYFSDAYPTNITVSGSVKLDYLGRRRLGYVGGEHGMDEMRRSLLDKPEVAEVSNFIMDVSLTSEQMGSASDVVLSSESDPYSSASVHGSNIVFVLMIVAGAIMIKT